jgi:hypothetical protein
MVRALLDGTKTQTRRVMKVGDHSGIYRLRDGWIQAYIGDGADDPAFPPAADDSWMGVQSDWGRGFRCPYGLPGDRLWVRETFTIGYPSGDPGHFSVIPPSGSVPQKDGVAFYAATFFDKDPDGPRMPWKPSIHMPRWASRITLEITDVRVQRLQAISAGDALAEGVASTEFWTPKELDGKPFEEKWWDDFEFHNRYPLIVYQRLWESINGAGSWGANDWIWAITFKRCEVPCNIV